MFVDTVSSLITRTNFLTSKFLQKSCLGKNRCERFRSLIYKTCEKKQSLGSLAFNPREKPVRNEIQTFSIVANWKSEHTKNIMGFGTFPQIGSHHDHQQRYFSAKTKHKKVTTLSLASQKRRGHKITMITAYDYPSALHVDRAGVDILLVGDSCAMVELGFETTQPMTLDQMIHHCKAVKRGAPSRPLLVGDMPLGTYEFDNVDIALKNAYHMIKEGGMDAVKLEGGCEARARTVRKLIDSGVAVMGHVGLTPQAISVIGGFRAQGRTAKRARKLLDESLRLQDAGAFAIVLECVPANVAKAITDTLEIPTIGIGAGNGTSGQVLVYHDMLGMLSHPHHEQFMPKFCKQYAKVGHAITEGIERFKREVESGEFPNDEYSPYVMTDEEQELFEDLLRRDANEREIKHDQTATKLKEADEYESLSLYGNSSEK